MKEKKKKGSKLWLIWEMGNKQRKVKTWVIKKDDMQPSQHFIYATTGCAQAESKVETYELWMLISQSCFLSVMDYFLSLFFLMRTANPD